jgi:hypothetical protein
MRNRPTLLAPFWSYAGYYDGIVTGGHYMKELNQLILKAPTNISRVFSLVAAEVAPGAGQIGTSGGG